MITYTTRGFPKCCGTPMVDAQHSPWMHCRQCKQRLPYATLVRRNVTRGRHGVCLHDGQVRSTAHVYCTGLHCRRPECRKRRKERLRKAWEEREAKRLARPPPLLVSPKLFAALAHPPLSPITLQDDRWRLEVEARARRYVTSNELAERYRLAMATSEAWEQGIQALERQVAEKMR